MISFSSLVSFLTDLDEESTIIFSTSIMLDTSSLVQSNYPTLTLLAIADHTDADPLMAQKVDYFYKKIFDYLTQKMQNDTENLDHIVAQWEFINHILSKAPSLASRFIFLKQLCHHPRCMDALPILVHYFGLTPEDLYVKTRNTKKIRTIKRLSTNDLPLPPSLSDYQHTPFVNLTQDMGYNTSFFSDIQRLTALDEQSICWIQWMIRQEMLSFSLLMKKVLAATDDPSSFFSWLNEWKELAQVTDDMLTDPAWLTKKDQVSPRQQAIRHIVANGFPEDFERLACAKYVLREERRVFFGAKNKDVTLDATNLTNNISLLQYFLAALPSDISGISLCGYQFDDQTFSVVMERLSRFISLDTIIFDQLLSEQQQAAFAQLIRRIPSAIHTVFFNRPYAPENKTTLEFLLTLDTTYIDVDTYSYNSRDREKELDFRFFCHNMACQQQREGGSDIQIDLNAEHICLSPTGVENIFRFLSDPQAADKVTVISGSMDDWNSVQIQDFFSLLKGLNKLRELHLEYKEAVLISQRIENLKVEKPDLQFSVVKATKKNTPSITTLILQEDETIENAVRYTEQWVVEKMDHHPVHVDAYMSDNDIPQVLSSLADGLGSCLSIDDIRTHFSPFQHTIPSLRFGNHSVFEEAKKYAKVFFSSIIIPVAEERERLAQVLEATLDSSGHDTDAKEAAILSHRIHLLSGFLDEQGRHLTTFEETIIDKVQRGIVLNQTLIEQKRKLIQHLEKDMRLMFNKTASFSSVKVSTGFLKERLPSFTVPESVSDDAKVAALHESRKCLGNVIKKCIGTVLMIPASIITVCSLGYCNAVHSTYITFFTTKTAETLYRAKDHIPTLSREFNRIRM